MPTPLDILIRVIADTKGATDATAALNQVQAAAEKASTTTTTAATASTTAQAEATSATKSTTTAAAAAATGVDKLADATKKSGGELRDFSRYGEAGQRILQGINRAASGGLIDTLLGVGGAIRGVISAAGINPFAGFIAAIVGAGGMLVALTKLKQGSAVTTRGLEEMKVAAEDLVAVRLDQIEAGFRSQGETLANNTKELQLQLALQLRLVNAQAQANIAAISANPALDDPTKSGLIAQQNQSIRLAEAGTEIERERIIARDAQARADEAAAEVAALTRQRDQALAVSIQLDRRRREAPQERERLVDERQNTAEETQLLRARSDPNSSAFIEADKVLVARMRDINRRLEALDQFIEDNIAPTKKGESGGKPIGPSELAIKEVEKTETALKAAEDRRVSVKDEADAASRRFVQTEAGVATISAENERKAAAERDAAISDERRKQNAAQRDVAARELGARAARFATRVAAGETAEANPALAERAATLQQQAKSLQQSGAEPKALAAAEAELRKMFDAAKDAGLPVPDELLELGRAMRAFREQLEQAAAQDLSAAATRAGAGPTSGEPLVPRVQGPGEITIAGRPFTPPARENTAPARSRPDTPLAPEPAPTPIIDGQKIGDDIGTAAAAAINAQLDDIPGRARGGPVKKGKRHLVGEEGPELFVPATDGTIIPADKTPQAAATPQSKPTPTLAPSNVNPAGHTIAPSNSNPPDEQQPDGIIRSNAQAQQRAKEQSAAFHADPANAPRGPRPPTPPNPAGSGFRNAEWHAAFQSMAASMPRAATAEDIGAAIGVHIRGLSRTNGAVVSGLESMAAEQTRTAKELREQRYRSRPTYHIV